MVWLCNLAASLIWHFAGFAGSNRANRHDRGNVAQSARQDGVFCINPRKGALGSVDTYVK